MYTERKQMRNMMHHYEQGLYNSTEQKREEAQLKSELNNYLFRGLIKLNKPERTIAAVNQLIQN